MLYVLSKVVGFFIQPFNFIMAVVIVSVLIRNARWQKRLLLAAVGLFLFFSNEIILNQCLWWWEKPAIPIRALPGEFAYAVVLGGTVDTDREPGDRLFFHRGADRVTHALSLYKAGKVKKIIYTDGNSRIGEDPTRDNTVVRDFYIMCGVAPNDLIMESSSRNTRENALLVKDLIARDHQVGRVVLVTSAYHMRRAESCFRQVGLEVTGFSTDFYSELPGVRFGVLSLVPSVRVLNDWRILMKEWIGYIGYRVAGYM